MDKTKNVNLPVVKELPADLLAMHPNDENGVWVWASREVMDTVGDIVRIDGIDFGTFHNPPETHLKILAQHIRNLPDGKSPVVGLVKDYIKTITPYKGSMVKGLALYVEWLRDSDTKELLDLAAHYKQQVAAGGIDSVSIGFMMDEYSDIEDGGYDITKSTIFECSFVTVPANASANVVKEISAGLHGFLDEAAVKKSQEERRKGAILDLDAKMDRVVSYLKADLYDHLSDMLAPILSAQAQSYVPKADDRLDHIGQSLNSLVETIKNYSQAQDALVSSIKRMTERLDTLDSAVVVLTEQKAAKAQPECEDQEQLRALSAKLDKLTKFVSA